MSSKINFKCIIQGHLKSLIDDNSEKTSRTDLVSFFVLPCVFSILCAVFLKQIPENTIGLIVNISSIFTALLLSVIMLIYDQYGKAKNQLDVFDKKSQHADFTKELNKAKLRVKILKQLYSNISYSVLVSLILVVFSLLYSFFSGWCYITDAIFIFIISFLSINLILTVLMVTKRVFLVLDSE